MDSEIAQSRRSLLALVFRLRSQCRRILYFLRYRGRAITIHPSTRISRRAVIRANGGGTISIGKNCEIHDYAIIMTYGGDISFGDNCSLNPFSIVYGHGGVRIGDGVRIAAHTVIIPAKHNLVPGGRPLYLSGVTAVGINISDNVWLGAGSRVLDGVSIGRNAVVGAGGVVTKSIPENTVVAGVPARAISPAQTE